MHFQLRDIATLINATIEGPEDVVIYGFAKIEEGKKGDISFLANTKYETYIYKTESSAVIVKDEFQPKSGISASLLRVKDPYSAIAALMSAYEKNRVETTPYQANFIEDEREKEKMTGQLASFAYISKDVSIGVNTKIGPGCYIGKNVKIGENTTVLPNVTIHDNTHIGHNCFIHANVVIGSEGFGFAPKADGSFDPIPQLGNVIIGDHVSIGSGTCIDRATMGSTKIGNGVKLDNLVQVGHNVEIGDHTVIAAQTGIAGSTKIGKYCVIGGQVGFAGHISVADHTKIGGQASVTKTIKETHQSLMGRPLLTVNAYLRLLSKLKNL